MATKTTVTCDVCLKESLMVMTTIQGRDFCHGCISKILHIVTTEGNINGRVMPFACPRCGGKRTIEEDDSDWDRVRKKHVECKNCGIA